MRERGVAQDHGEQVVEVVRDAAGEAARRPPSSAPGGAAPRAARRLFSPLARRHVPRMPNVQMPAMHDHGTVGGQASNERSRPSRPWTETVPAPHRPSAGCWLWKAAARTHAPPRGGARRPHAASARPAVAGHPADQRIGLSRIAPRLELADQDALGSPARRWSEYRSSDSLRASSVALAARPPPAWSSDIFFSSLRMSASLYWRSASDSSPSGRSLDRGRHRRPRPGPRGSCRRRRPAPAA